MIFPLRFRPLDHDQLIFGNDAGDFFLANEAFLERYVTGSLTSTDRAFLDGYGHSARDTSDLAYLSHLRKVALRHASPGRMSYVILVPTLRCNLSCTYCQVSRAAESARGYDWDESTLTAVLNYLDGLETQRIKIEFQGGEPTLRLDILERVIAFCGDRFEEAEFVVCTNLQRLGPAEAAIFDRPNVYISTSLDGHAAVHEKNRTKNSEQTAGFFANLKWALNRFGQAKVSALPTIDYSDPPDIDLLLDAFAGFGFRSIYLRPVNYQGFARKAHSALKDDVDRWNEYYFSFIDRLIERNYADRTAIFEEYYFSLCLSRALRPGHDSHVDLRNPSWFARDYIVIDHDGTFYPTDEARMVTRIGLVDLSIGNVFTYIDAEKVRCLNQYALNSFNEDCIHCPYQPYCGTDIIDDLSRYGRVDAQKLETWFCRRHMAIFDRIFRYLYSRDPKVRFSLAAWARIPSDSTDLGVRHHDTPAS